jgi:hypothetical protein
MAFGRIDSPGISWTRRLGLAAAAALTALLLGHPASGDAAAIRSSAGSWIVLDSGRLGDQTWSVKAMRGSGGSSSRSGGGRQSCIAIGAITQISPYNFHRSSYRHCDSLPGRGSAGAAPLVASGVFTGEGRNLTAVGMIFPAGVRRARITFSDGSATVIRANRLATEEAREAGLEEYRYAAFSVPGRWCAVSLASIGRSGRTLWAGDIDTPC